MGKGMIREERDVLKGALGTVPPGLTELDSKDLSLLLGPGSAASDTTIVDYTADIMMAILCHTEVPTAQTCSSF